MNPCRRGCLKTFSTFRDSSKIVMRRDEGIPPYFCSFETDF